MRVGAEWHIYPTDLALDKGEFNVLLGTTLSGKTTLMRLMAGLERPTQGEVWFDGDNVTGVPVQKRSVAMVYQAFINYPSFSVFDNIASPLRVARLPEAEIRKRVGEIAELLKLSPMLDRVPSELSGGQQQRTALARALVKRAPLVLLDEPLANLDYKLREELREELPRLFAEAGTTVVYATSEPLEALMLGGRVATLHEGRVSQYGATADVYHSPQTLITAQVFADPPINTAPARVRGGQLQLADGVSWTLPERMRGIADGDYTLAFRAHHLTLAKEHADSVAIRGRVSVAEISGSESTIHITVGELGWISESHGVHPFKVGDEVTLYLKIERGMLFDAQGRRIDE